MMDITDYSLKEVMELIESRIPYGRKVTSILIGLLLLWLATAASVSIYHSLVAPALSLFPRAFWGGKVHLGELSVIIVGPIISGVIIFFGATFIGRAVSRRLEQVTASHNEVVDYYKEVKGTLSELNIKLDSYNEGTREFRRTAMKGIEILDNEVSDLKKQLLGNDPPKQSTS